MKKIEIRPLRGIYRLIQKNREKKLAQNKKMISSEIYRLKFEETIAIAQEFQYN